MSLRGRGIVYDRRSVGGGVTYLAWSACWLLWPGECPGRLLANGSPLWCLWLRLRSG